MKNTIIELEYPGLRDLHFPFPSILMRVGFEDSLELRTRVLVDFLEQKRIEAITKGHKDPLKGMPHDLEDFIVESVTKTEDGEIWHIGS